MFINRDNKPGLVKRMDWISFVCLILFVCGLWIYLDKKKNYTELHRDVKSNTLRIERLEER